MDLSPEVNLSYRAAKAIARGLYAVAKSDGLHERESGLITSFWLDAGGGASSLADLERADTIQPAELAGALAGKDERLLFVKTAVLLGWADGQVSDAERKIISEYASALGIDAFALNEVEAAVKEFLLGHIAHLQNTDATAQVAKKLNM